MKFGNLKIGQRLGAGFGTVILLMLLANVLGALGIQHVSTSIRRTSEELYPKTVAAASVKDALNDTARAMRNVLFLNTAADIERELNVISTAGARARDMLGKLEGFALSSEDRQILGRVKAAREKFQPALDGYVKLIKEGQIEQARDLGLPELAPLQQQYFAALDQLIVHEGKLMVAAGDQAAGDSTRALTLMVILAGLGSLLAVAVGTLVTRSITRPLASAVVVAEDVARGDLRMSVTAQGRDETGQLLHALGEMVDGLRATVLEVGGGARTITGAAQELASGNAELSARTNSQAAALQQTSSSLEALSAAVQQNAASVGQADALVGTAFERARAGGDVVREVVATMGSAKESSRRIVDIIATIDGIAFQTNILALNAAVEAARAGGQGRGFAVVAAEVRNLAQRAATAAKEIKVLIVDTVEKVNAGSALVDETGRAMGAIMESVERVAGITKQISGASQEQSAGIAEIDRAVAAMDKMTQQNAALVEQAAHAAESLRTQALRLEKSIALFKVAAGGGAHVADALVSDATAPAAPEGERPGGVPARFMLANRP